MFLRAFRVFRNEGWFGIKQRILQRLSKPRDVGEWCRERSYEEWVSLYDTLTDTHRHLIKTRMENLDYRPLFSILVPIYNAEERWLRLAIESMLKQLYPHWELCIADDCSTHPHIRTVLDEFAGRDKRIKLIVRETTGQLSAAANSSLSLASGEFVALLQPNDELAEYALYLVAQELNAFPEADLIYSDEDKLNSSGERYEPSFKPDWSPDLFYSCNFISHLAVYRRSVLEEIGGFHEGFEGSQEYDLTLRFIERIPEKNIRHIPHVLYHCRELSSSTGCKIEPKPYERKNARRALRSHFERTGRKAEIVSGYFNSQRIIYPLPEPAPLVSLIVPTRDRVDLLRQVVSGILEKTAYDPLEIIIVDNQTSDPQTLTYLATIRSDKRVRVIPYDAPFNYSAMNNLAVGHARGEIIGLVNNDIKVIHPEWLREMVSHAARPEIGVVGAKLYYQNDTIQHAGIILGNVAEHAHKRLPRYSEGYMYRTHLIQNFSAVTGACLLTRREVFDEVGGLNEVDLAISFNDVDFCLRVSERGYRILWTPYAELYHLESISRGTEDTPERLPRFYREVSYLKARWGSLLLQDPYYNPNLTITRDDFSLDGACPRVPRPWMVGS